MSWQPRGSVLIAAVSGRALARAASDAGYTPLVADFFADRDTDALAQGVREMPGAIARGFQQAALMPALEALAREAPSPLIGLVYGSGFEDRTRLLAPLAERWPLLGNNAETVAQINDPARFFAELARCGIAYPETHLDRPRDPEGWIAKRVGGAGGSHVGPAGARKGRTDLYFQRLVSGRSISALFAASARDAVVLGFSEQWTAPAPGKPWRFGGACQPADISRDARERMTEIVLRLADAFGLAGLNSADFVLHGDDPMLLEVNPRPGATLDIFASTQTPLLKIHFDAVRQGALPSHPPAFEGAAASAIVFAPKTLTSPVHMAWPAWAADVPKIGQRIDKERPICTLLARAGSVDDARRLLQTRVNDLLNALDASEHPERTQ